MSPNTTPRAPTSVAIRAGCEFFEEFMDGNSIANSTLTKPGLASANDRDWVNLARMPAELHETSLIALLAVGFVLALLFGLGANLLKVSPIVGYLVAGVAVGPFTPGFVADGSLATQLAEIGVILLMFGVGLHFSIKDLMSVRAIALPGAVAQIATATAIGAGMAHLMGWSLGT